MKERIIKLALWVLMKCGKTVLLYPLPDNMITLPIDLTSLVVDARSQCSKFEFLDATGEWKRYHVNAILQKQFPMRPKKDISLAIEYAVRSL
jgi:hypothetical protein